MERTVVPPGPDALIPAPWKSWVAVRPSSIKHNDINSVLPALSKERKITT
jgi:hypothetical protein